MQRTIKNPVGFLWNIPLIVIIGFLASCSGIKSSPSEESLPLQQSTTHQIPTADTTNPGWDLNPGQNLRFEKISLEDGLSQSTIFTIIQDKQGYMWFATEDGLNKYDSYHFTVYKNNPDNPSSLSDNWILTLFWWLWHIPTYWTLPFAMNAREQYGFIAAFGIQFVVLLALGIMCAWVFNGSGESVLMPVLMHAGWNFWSGAFGQDAATFLMPMFLVTAILVIIITRGKLALSTAYQDLEVE